MDWDLITERNLQQFIRLAELGERPLLQAMCWRHTLGETYLHYRGGRLHLSQYMPHAAADGVLRQGLQRWHPARFAGVPQRLYALGAGLAISCSPPTHSTAELWLGLHLRQQTFLEALCRGA
ncbi:hypothetical protein SGGMMB4_02910 [Sodalis glossinidius str. 'morsitans']|uniref:Type III secretion apparatus n=1 Tax=Sodalis glossinidius (strain morsitans) TaxID=343509 RepID=Q2NTF1_SODGM|nr:type III secretion system apparatus protein [Sodalis glossinidius]BAE74574.1 type III secretion apparatus [Sodalis glossinidius str. 'morsitans']CRL45295.1 hypothetical protein SGGMMB4_02910 [Sodalis glossinidius str. 'morsitans']